MDRDQADRTHLVTSTTALRYSMIEVVANLTTNFFRLATAKARQNYRLGTVLTFARVTQRFARVIFTIQRFATNFLARRAINSYNNKRMSNTAIRKRTPAKKKNQCANPWN